MAIDHASQRDRAKAAVAHSVTYHSGGKNLMGEPTHRNEQGKDLDDMPIVEREPGEKNSFPRPAAGRDFKIT